MDDSDYFDDKLPTSGKSKCSPQLDKKFTGVRLAGPKQVNLGQHTKIPLCGGYRLANTVISILGARIVDETVIVFVNIKTHQAISFNLIPNKDRVDGPRPELISGDYPELAADKILNHENFMTETYFNIDVFYFKPDFPKLPARYTVYALNRGIKSNVIEIEITK
ncbi:MAG: hypothetical protein HY080_00410 [Gammaproteobacteria bacterium]|nr:hypothetical protein [Gammaproteobacteria bacterium]